MTLPQQPSIPLSGAQALREARPEAIGDVFSRDPEFHTEEDTRRVIKECREQRARHEEAERIAQLSGKKSPKAQKGEGMTSTDKSLDELLA
jgi:hypothetical protein